VTDISSFLDRLDVGAKAAARAEDDFRRETAARAKALERERAFAYRRLNFMRAIAEAVATVESEEIAVAAAIAVMRTKLGWSSDSEARTDVLARFAPVAEAVFADLAPRDDDAPPRDAPPPDVIGVLADFEAWYGETHPNSFWVLFEHYMPQTPLVDF
jgi:hypothetical protein